MKRISLICPTICFLTLFTLPQEVNSQTGTWQSIGPEGISYSSTVTYDQFSKKLYLLGNQKIFRSDNNGNSWIDISPGQSGDYTDLLFSSKNDTNGLYAIISNKVYQSTDIGKNWRLFYSDSARHVFYIDKNNPNEMLATKVTNEGMDEFFQTIHKSTDAGKNWSILNNGIDTADGPLFAIVNPYYPENIIAIQYLSFGGDIVYNEKAFQSTNGGLSWSKINLDTLVHVNSVVFDPQIENTFYIKRYSKSWSKTADGGTTWIDINKGLPVDTGTLSDRGLNVFTISPFNSNTLYIAVNSRYGDTSEFFKSEDGGLNWHLLSKIAPSEDVSSILVDPQNKDELFACSYPCGIYHSSDKGKEWSLVSKGITQSVICSFSAFDSRVLYAIVSGRGICRTTDGGQSWDLISTNRSTCGSDKIKVSRNNPDVLFTSSYINGKSFSISYDKANTWRSFSYEGVSKTFDIASDNQTIFGAAHSSSRINKSTDGGSTWVELDPGISDSSSVEQITIDPSDKDIVYAIIWIRGAENKMSLIKSIDGGKSWKVIADSAGNVYINKYKPENIYYTEAETLFISNNRGTSFSRVATGYYLGDIVFDSTGNGALYALTSGGIIRSVDNGVTWTRIGDSAKVYGVRNIELCYSDSGNPVLFGSTSYNGIMKYELHPKSSTASPRIKNEKSFSVSRYYVNPSNSTVMFNYYLTTAKQVKLTIYDILGKEIACLINKQQSPGRFEVEWNAKKFSGGNYFCVFKVGESLETKKLMVVK